METKIKKIDATDMPLGRLATEVAFYLMGKNDPNYQRHNLDTSNEVHILNVNDLKVTGNKMEGKKYHRHTGYPGGLKTLSMKELIEKKGTEEVLKKAVSGMLPKNKLKPGMLKNLKFITEK